MTIEISKPEQVKRVLPKMRQQVRMCEYWLRRKASKKKKEWVILDNNIDKIKSVLTKLTNNPENRAMLRTQ